MQAGVEASVVWGREGGYENFGWIPFNSRLRLSIIRPAVLDGSGSGPSSVFGFGSGSIMLILNTVLTSLDFICFLTRAIIEITSLTGSVEGVLHEKMFPHCLVILAF